MIGVGRVLVLAPHPDDEIIGCGAVLKQWSDSGIPIKVVVITDGANNATIAVDIRSWFRNPDGSVINPATANPGQPNAGVVSERIKVSLRAFEDDDKNGQ